FTRAKAMLGPNHLHTLLAMVTLAETYLEAGQVDKGLPLAEEAIPRMKAALGPDHPRTLDAMRGLATSFWNARRLDK
ncbi:tetratricopeptide repeat protein, partial [Klebsiella pneumoniae]|uniref:tetratricopeptide repeat protein n=1 Tax=Klebsiella pneumoniae TaxID=573 RepID=UPI0030140FB4